MAANKIILQSGSSIGNNGAESDDAFLFKCFVDHPCYSAIADTENPSTFLLASTGAGKTAILRMLQHQKNNACEVELQSISIRYLSGSDTVQFLQAVGADTTLLFQSLWRHILCVEYVKLALNAKSKDQIRFKFNRIIDSISAVGNKKKLERFLDENEGRFWNTIDQNMIELTDDLQKSFSTEFGGEVKKFVAKAGYVHNLGAQQKIHLKQRATQFVENNIVDGLPGVIIALSDYTRNRNDKYYLLIDGLDENWVDDRIRFQMIQALFETSKGLRKLRNFQLAIALRNDLYVRMVDEAKASRAQIEKYEDLIIRIKWTKSQLRTMADKRIGEMFKRKYSSENVILEHIFSQKPNGRDAPWDYIVERTLYRPRDVINFINTVLEVIEGKTAVSKNDFIRGEAIYSALRFDTLVHEWSGTFPAIRSILELLRNRPPYGSVAEYVESRLIETLYDAAESDIDVKSDEVWKLISDYVDSKVANLEAISICEILFYRLHLIGAVGLKLNPEAPWNWVYETQKPVSRSHITVDTKFKIHPMLFAALGSKTNKN